MTGSNVLMAKEGLAVKLEPELTTIKLLPGQIRLRVDVAALTVNVLGYAMSGLTLGYYAYFPVQNPDDNEADWGRVPTWGTCTVVETTVESQIPLNARFYGLVPLSNTFVAWPKKVKKNGSFFDQLEHRRKGNVVYNTYVNLDSDALYTSDREREMVLLRPLFLTGWLLREALFALNIDQVVITSASSKTGMILACLLRQQPQQQQRTIKVVGLTSSANLAFTQQLGVYDDVVDYANVNTAFNTSSSSLSAVVDFAGNVPVLLALQRTLGSSLRDILCVGASHVKEADLAATLQGEGFLPEFAKPKFFFAPKYANQVAKRDPQALDQAMPRDWHWFVKEYSAKVLPTIRLANGADEVKSVIERFAENKVPGSESWLAANVGGGSKM